MFHCQNHLKLWVSILSRKIFVFIEKYNNQVIKNIKKQKYLLNQYFLISIMIIVDRMKYVFQKNKENIWKS